MTAAPSQKTREGAAPTKSTSKSDAEQPALQSSRRYRQAIDYEEPGRSKLTPALGLTAKTIRIVSGPVSLRTFAFWGVVIFIAGFLHGRQMTNLAIGAAESVTRESAPVPQTAATAPAPVRAHENPAGITQVTIRLVKFSPETIEVKTGQTVEWTNDDLTPHTVTSQGAGDLNSGSIDAGASWRHTFTQAGSFPYYCTFHPEMKGTILVN
jgi:plastocyanin